jgi:hypothetical protein
MGDEDDPREMELREFQEQAAKLLKTYDIHIADSIRGGSTLCGKPITPANSSTRRNDVTCQACLAEENWRTRA